MATVSMCIAPVESFSLAFLNPPYDWTIGEGRNERLERVFLAHAYRWLKAGGVLVLVVPVQHVCDCGEILASRFKDTRIFRLTDPEAVRYRQVVSWRHAAAVGSANN